MVRLSVDVSDADFPEELQYHKGRNSRADGIPAKDRKFIAWDGEGMNLSGPGKPQHYVLFGCSTGENIKGRNLRTFEIMDFALKIAEENPGSIHVGFAFTYDSNMIVKSLSSARLRTLHKEGFVKLKNGADTYTLQMRKGKWLSITRYKANYDRKSNSHAKVTVRIYDIFGFFTCSFVKAVEEMLGKDAPGMDIVREGKAARNDFTYEEMDYVERYWRAEIELLRLVAEELRTRLWGAGLKITTWHGPGALASYVNKTNGMKAHMRENRAEIREASRYAYAGGRFELFKAGRIVGPIYSMDINSAYPYAISQLPSMQDGDWFYTSEPTSVVRFGVYHIRFNNSRGFDRAAGPVFHRDAQHNISFPHIVEGWYWSPEVAGLIGREGVEVLEGWEFIEGMERPFYWVEEMYEKRREWKAAGNPQQMALKLCMNSLYGKMAQRVGYDEKTGRKPPWHQLEWAGWVTSYTRSMLFAKMKQMPTSDLIAVETDGIYCLRSPDKLGIVDSKALGGWETDVYDEIIYLQSGLAWLRKGDVWTPKRRGLDAGSFTLDASIEFCKRLNANEKWEPYIAESTRFIGLGAALNGSGPCHSRLGVWETTPREVMPGEKGKRFHFPKTCAACRAGMNAYDMAHDLVIRSNSRVGEMTTPHSIPWEGKDDNASVWRSYAEGL